MIFGNPDKFSILIDVVEEWSSPDFKEGLFFYIIGDDFCVRRIPDNSATIAVYMHELSLTLKAKVVDGYESAYLFNLPTEQAYSELNAIRFVPFEEDIPADAVEDYTHSITVGDMLSDIDEIYLVSHDIQEKILYKAPNTGEILECVLEKGYAINTMKQALEWWNSLNIKGQKKL